MMFLMTSGLEEMLIGMVANIFERFPSTNIGYVEKGLLNQSNSLLMVNLRSSLFNWSIVGINNDLW